MNLNVSSDGERAPARYLPGDFINDRYEVRETLGAGGSAAVYRVHDGLTDEEFALKLLAPEMGVEAARREYKAANSQPMHTNIAAVIQIEQTRTVPPAFVIIQEYVDGATLSDFCTPAGPHLDTDEVVEVLDQLLCALESIHPDTARIKELEVLNAAGTLTTDEYYELGDLRVGGIVHRDVKPQNIRRRHDGVIKLIDFGIASAAGSTVHTRTATPEYAPPDADPFSWSPLYDLFAVGVIAFELLAGCSPFRQAMPALGRDVVPDRWNDVERPLRKFVERSIAEDSTARYDSAAQMRKDLAASARGQSDAHPPESVVSESKLDQTVAADAVSTGEPPKTRGSSSVAGSAAQAGMTSEYQRALDIAARHQLGVRHYKRSVMLTPPGNLRRYLVNLAFKAGEGCKVAVSPANWSAYYDVTPESISADLEPPGRPPIDAVALNRLLDRLESVLQVTPRSSTTSEPAPVTETIVNFLRANPGGHTIDEVALATRLERGSVRKRLSDLSRDSCVDAYRGSVVVSGQGLYSAAPSDAASRATA